MMVPNVLWQLHHHWPTLQFHVEHVGESSVRNRVFPLSHHVLQAPSNGFHESKAERALLYDGAITELPAVGDQHAHDG